MARYYQFRPIDVSDTAVRKYLDAENPTVSSAVWYGEYSQFFASRLFAVHAGHVEVAPYDMAFIDAQGLHESPPTGDVRDIFFREFEMLWEELAQPRLDALARLEVAPFPTVQVLYVKSPFPASFKDNEPSSDLYTEWADGVARRHFEVFPDRVIVATHDPEAGWPEHYEIELEAVEYGTAEGISVDPLLRPIRLSHAAFEEVWERYALKRLRALADLPGE